MCTNSCYNVNKYYLMQKNRFAVEEKDGVFHEQQKQTTGE